MHEYTPEAAQAIEGRQRQFMNRLMVDWNNNGRYDHPLSNMTGFVVRTNRDQAISSTAPDELMLIEGFSAGSLEVEVAGNYEGLPLTGHFAPFNGRSVFYAEGLRLGVDMYYEIGVWTQNGWEYFRQFTGVVREVDANRGNGVVALDCLDNVEKLRTSVSLPAYGLRTAHLQDGAKRGGLVDSSSIIDLSARTGGFSMGPKPGIGGTDPKRTTIFSAPMHGSTIPELGMFDNYQEVHQTEAWHHGTAEQQAHAEAFGPGPHGYLALNAVPKGDEFYGHKTYWVTEETTAGMGLAGTFVIGAWIYWDGPGSAIDSDVVALRNQRHKLILWVRGLTGEASARLLVSDGGTDTYAGFYDSPLMQMQEGWNYVEAGFECHDVIKGRTRIGDQTSEITVLYGDELVFYNDVLSGLVEVQNYHGLSDIEIHRSNWYFDLHNTSKDITLAANADVSWGRNRIAYTLRDTDTPAWDLAKDVAAAEYGVVMFDEYGKFCFWNFEDITGKSATITRKFTLSDVEGLSMRTTMDSVRNQWVVTTQSGQSKPGVFWDYAKDGQPWYEDDNGGGLNDPAALRPHSFIIPDVSWVFFFLRAKDNLMCPNPYTVPDLAEFYPWDDQIPHHGKKTYRGDDYIGNTAPYVNPITADTEQKWVGNEWVRMSILSRMDDGGAIGFVLESKDQGRFRVGGTMVYEDQPVTWSVVDQESVDTYGARTLELKGNFWLQDRFQTEDMLEKVVAKFGRPIPVTDDITVAGDPRVQIGDVIQITDPEGMGARIHLQVYGIKREMTAGAGLTDTYSVEVIQPPGVGIWDDPSYGIWDLSLIWGD